MTGTLAGYYTLVWAVIYRDLAIWLRYPVNAASRILAFLAIFGLIFLGGELVAGQAIAGSVEGLIVGYFLWTLATVAYVGISTQITREASWGTLERHFISPYGFNQVMFLKAVARVLRGFLVASVVLLLVMVITGTWLSLPLLTVAALALFSILSVVGLGFATGGLTVLYKRIENLTQLLQFVFVGLITAPAFDVAWFRLLPLVEGSRLLQHAMKRGTRLWEFPPEELFVLVAVAVAYLVAGYFIFYLTQRRARQIGVLGDY